MAKRDFSLILYLIVIFLASIIVFFLFGFLINKINLFLLVLIISFIVLVFTYIFFKIKEQEVPIGKGKTALRYTMLCHRCNWEWMSNTAEKQPVKCPNCGEKSKLEVVGWRKVNVISKKSNKDLMNYFK